MQFFIPHFCTLNARAFEILQQSDVTMLFLSIRVLWFYFKELSTMHSHYCIRYFVLSILCIFVESIFFQQVMTGMMFNASCLIGVGHCQNHWLQWILKQYNLWFSLYPSSPFYNLLLKVYVLNLFTCLWWVWVIWNHSFWIIFGSIEVRVVLWIKLLGMITI